MAKAINLTARYGRGLVRTTSATMPGCSKIIVGEHRLRLPRRRPVTLKRVSNKRVAEGVTIGAHPGSTIVGVRKAAL